MAQSNAPSSGSASKNWLEVPNKLLFGGSNREDWLCTLDNFYLQPMTIPVPYAPQTEPKTFNTIEHYFQAAKFFGFNDEWADHVRQAPDGKQAQLRGREMRLPKEVLQRWKDGESSVAMRRALRAKFVELPDEPPAAALRRTGDRTLVELVEDDPTWDDKLWGAGKDGSGVNRMGILLMEVREQLQRQ